jgi:hypothetical protein
VQPIPLQSVDDLAYGDTVPGVTCPECGGELVHTSNGAFCDWDSSFVPVVGSAVVVSDEEDDESEWDDDEDAS